MASDSLNQIGKYIRKTGKDADRAVKRAYPIQPRLERIRDIFDSSTAFEMQFDTTDNDKRVLLDLFFTLPPPIRGCKSGCIFSKCGERAVPTGIGSCSDDCGITDTFTRTFAWDGLFGTSGWGVTDFGLPWYESLGAAAISGASVNGSQGVLADVYTGGGFNSYTEEFLVVAPKEEWSFTATFSFSLIDTVNEPVLTFTAADLTLVLTQSTSTDKVFLGDGGTHIDFAFSANISYDIHYERDINGMGHFNIWLSGTEEPSGWMLEAITEARDNTFLIDYNPSAGRYPTVGYVYIDNLNISDLNNCVEFDTFERPDVAFDWGTGDDGGTWFDGGPGNGTRSIQSGYGHIRHDQPFAGQTYTYRTQSASGGTSPYLGDFTMTTQFKVIAKGTPPTGNTHIMVAEGPTGNGDGPSISFAASALGFFYSDDVDPPTTAKTWSVDAEYNLKWERSGNRTIDKVKTWLVGDTEPSSWDIETGSSLAIEPNTFQIFHTGGDHIVGPTEIAFAFFHFDYAKGDCCGPDGGEYEIYDSFTRTAGPLNWGGPADAGFSWNASIEGNGSATVDGSTGRITITHTPQDQFDGSSTISVNPTTDLVGGLRFNVPFTYSFDITEYVNTNPDDITFYSGVYGNDQKQAEFYLHLSASLLGINGAVLVTTITGDALTTGLYSTGPSATSGTVSVSGDTNGVTVRYGGTVLYQPWRGIFPDTSPTTIDSSVDFYWFYFAINVTTPGGTGTLGIDNLRIKDLFHHGTMCSETTIVSVDNECFTLNHPYEPGSVSVIINDVTLPASQVNETNPEAGEICIQGISGATDITICYMYKEGCT